LNMLTYEELKAEIRDTELVLLIETKIKHKNSKKIVELYEIPFHE